MGKKSLFTSTTADGAASPGKKRPAKKKADQQTPQAPPVPAKENSPPHDPVARTPAASARPPATPAGAVGVSLGCSAPVLPQILEDDGDSMTRLVLGVVGAVAFIVLILLVASSMNAGRYYVKESRGAVEIWKGDFSPGGGQRILVLHDAVWDMKKKRYYNRETALGFASRYYVRKAGDLLEAQGVRDYPRILSYVDKAIVLNADMGNDDRAAVLEIVKKDIQEAALLDSGEPETLGLVTRKINAAGHGLAGLLFEDR
ncbi:MAG: hypothetical protein ACOZBW_14645 [Thermodesulfobacteriota bacterium]